MFWTLLLIKRRNTMKKTFVSMAAAALVFFASAPIAQAAANPYVSASAGVAFLSDSDIEWGGVTIKEAVEYKTGYAVNGAVGLDGGMYRLEAAVGYQENKVDAVWDGPDPDADLSILSFMANGYIDFGMSVSPLEPYVMAGLGYASVEISEDGDSESDGVFAYQFGAGVGINATPNVKLDIGYRYFATTDVNFGGVDDLSIASNNIMAGVRVGLL